VGKASASFTVHEAVTRKGSLFFDKALKPKWANSRPDPRHIELSDNELEIFKIYLHLLYFKIMLIVSVENNGPSTPEYVLLSKCHVMDDKILNNGFKNIVMRAIVGATMNQPFSPIRFAGLNPINNIYAGTTENSPARRFLVDVWVKEAGERWLDLLTDELPHYFVLEFSRALLVDKCKQEKDSRSWKKRIVDYYE
jgi:hypothetical protein